MEMSRLQDKKAIDINAAIEIKKFVLINQNRIRISYLWNAMMALMTFSQKKRG